MKISIVTGNKGKLAEYRAALGSLGMEVEMSGLDCNEIQADTLEEVAADCLRQLEAQGAGNVLLDDSGLFVHALGGFPGVYSSYAMRTLGWEGLLKLLDGVSDRGAHFECCIAASLDGRRIIVKGRCDGRIALGPSGQGGFGFDPVFVPDGYDRTFSEMPMEEKNRVSHRGRALAALMGELR